MKMMTMKIMMIRKLQTSMDGDDNKLSDDDITASEDDHLSLPDNEEHHEQAEDQNEKGAVMKKSELEKLLIDNDQF